MQEGRSMYGSLPPINPSHLHILGLILWLDRRQRRYSCWLPSPAYGLYSRVRLRYLGKSTRVKSRGTKLRFAPLVNLPTEHTRQTWYESFLPVPTPRLGKLARG